MEHNSQGDLPTEDTSLIITSDYLLETSREIQRQACDDIEMRFIVTMEQLQQGQRVKQPAQLVELTPDKPTYTAATFPNIENDLHTAKLEGFFDNDDTSGGDGARSAQMSLSDLNLHTAVGITPTNLQPRAIDPMSSGRREPSPQSFRSSPTSATRVRSPVFVFRKLSKWLGRRWGSHAAALD
ncbi:unnamed protein product [Bursaphelenchus okinawaensis]|uniref:Uncharacterized protein n=1 Tax=Bursaphelenchus okinawaensis TaxID=465554 RepID=A0A811LKK1_9BILA|nr:unnamed protein product [Bursaphelenchus okinawaensis]CAG9127534.1 unnamed protein product [Bursaphelenchus okinawaensis]